MFQTIESISVQPNQQLLLHYSGGEEVLVDFRPLIERGGVFASLADPRFFAQVTVGERGRSIEWPGDLDFCADALWQEGQHQPQSGNENRAHPGAEDIARAPYAR